MAHKVDDDLFSAVEFLKAREGRLDRRRMVAVVVDKNYVVAKRIFCMSRDFASALSALKLFKAGLYSFYIIAWAFSRFL